MTHERWEGDVFTDVSLRSCKEVFLMGISVLEQLHKKTGAL